ncbi:MAG: hypothetical protein K2J71_01595 [Oscillospiraceae bacterium]|nr:hypothetical protein [Oscillospiraceae bacterium]
MRDYKTVAQRVLQRRDAYVLAQKRKKQMMIKYAAVPACLFLVVGAGFRIWKQTETGRHILEQNAVKTTETVAVISTESAGNLGNTENTENSEKSGNSENVNSTDFVVYEPAMTDPTQTDAESEPGHAMLSETRQTGRAETEVIVSDAPGIQETRPEQNGISPTAPANSTDLTVSTVFTETIPESTIPKDDNTATAPPSPSTDPPESDYMPEPTETKQDDPSSVSNTTEPTKPYEQNTPIPTEPEPTKPSDSTAWDPSSTEPEPTETDAPPSCDPEPPPSPDYEDWTTPSFTETNPTNSTTEPLSPSVVPSTTETTATTTITTIMIKNPTDYTVTVETFTPTSEQLEHVTQETISLDFPEQYNSFWQLVRNSEAVVRCKILSIGYTIRQDEPYTVCQVEILESVKGKFIAGDKLSVVQYGGYLIQYDSGSPELMELQIAYSEKPVIFQEYVLFLNPDSIFNGAYGTVHENEGVFRYDPKTDNLTRSVAQDVAINSCSYRKFLNLAAN